MRGMILIKQMG